MYANHNFMICFKSNTNNLFFLKRDLIFLCASVQCVFEVQKLTLNEFINVYLRRTERENNVHWIAVSFIHVKCKMNLERSA